MDIAIIIVMIVSSFLIGRLTATPQNNKLKKVELELVAMTESRDKWRYKYLVLIMREKLKEQRGKHGFPID
jgi:hypothetical protein